MLPTPTFGVSAVVLRDRQVLLNLREDFEVWGLPGGGVEPGESLPAAAVRETLEETGHHVEVHGLLGVYSVIGATESRHTVAFSARVSNRSRSPVGTPAEVLAVDWFPIDQLPDQFVWWHRQRILDAVDGRRGVHGTESIETRVVTSGRAELYLARDQSGMSRSEFFAWNFRRPQ